MVNDEYRLRAFAMLNHNSGVQVCDPESCPPILFCLLVVRRFLSGQMRQKPNSSNVASSKKSQLLLLKRQLNKCNKAADTYCECFPKFHYRHIKNGN